MTADCPTVASARSVKSPARPVSYDCHCNSLRLLRTGGSHLEDSRSSEEEWLLGTAQKILDAMDERRVILFLYSHLVTG